MPDIDYTKELQPDEPHPAAKHAMEFLRLLPLQELLAFQEVFASTALANNRNSQVCGETLRRLLGGEPVSDRYLLGLAWTILMNKIDLTASQTSIT